MTACAANYLHFKGLVRLVLVWGFWNIILPTHAADEIGVAFHSTLHGFNTSTNYSFRAVLRPMLIERSG